jgi:hypothetical protein
MKRLLLLALLLSGCASWTQTQSRLSVEDGWVRLMPPVAPNSAAYFTLNNQGKTAVDLIAVESDVAGVLELHTIVEEGELRRMQQLQKVTVPAQGIVQFKPGSYHVMLIGLKKPLQENQIVPFTLRFASGESLAVSLPVKQDGEGKHAHH